MEIARARQISAKTFANMVHRAGREKAFLEAFPPPFGLSS
jgi:hypothetical protein